MANRREGRFDDRWRDNPNRSYPQAQDRNEYERRNMQQWGQSEHHRYPEDFRDSEQWEEPQGGRAYRGEQWSQRGQNDTERDYGYRNQGQRISGYEEQSRDRPYSSSSSFEGDGGFSSHVDPYRQGRDRGFGATSTGTNWGAAEVGIGRHPLGSLTDSAAASARHVRELQARRDQYSGVSHFGKGPKGYRRSDERIREDVSELLYRHHEIDASNIEVAVSNGVVTLSGTAEDRRSKRLAEDIAHEVSGTVDVQNQIRIQSDSSVATSPITNQPAQASAASASTGQSGTSGSNSSSVLGLRDEPVVKR
jgi:hypothetical protein